MIHVSTSSAGSKCVQQFATLNKKCFNCHFSSLKFMYIIYTSVRSALAEIVNVNIQMN